MLTSKARMSPKLLGTCGNFHPSPTPPICILRNAVRYRKPLSKAVRESTGGVSVMEVKRRRLAEDDRHRKVLPHTVPSIGKLDFSRTSLEFSSASSASQILNDP